MAKLYLLSDGGKPAEEWEIGDRPIAVGRGASADARIDDEGLSRRHFMISPEGEEFVLRDLSSRNGTWVEGERTMLTRLRHNDCIVAGRTSFRFCEYRPESATGPRGTAVMSRS